MGWIYLRLHLLHAVLIKSDVLRQDKPWLLVVDIEGEARVVNEEPLFLIGGRSNLIGAAHGDFAVLICGRLYTTSGADGDLEFPWTWGLINTEEQWVVTFAYFQTSFNSGDDFCKQNKVNGMY